MDKSFLKKHLFSCIGSLLRHAGAFVIAGGLSSCGAWAQQLQYTGLVAPVHVGS